MPSSDKTRANLMASMQKTKGGATQAKEPAKRAATSKPAASSKKPQATKKKTAKKKAATKTARKTVKRTETSERRLSAVDSYQSNGRIWPD